MKCANIDCSRNRVKGNLYCSRDKCLAGKLYDCGMDYLLDQTPQPSVEDMLMFQIYCNEFGKWVNKTKLVIDNSWVYYSMVSSFYKAEVNV